MYINMLLNTDNKFVNEVFYKQAKVYEKFQINGPLLKYTQAEKDFRVVCLLEEYNEYKDAENNADKFDALIDLIVFVAGTFDRENLLIQGAGFYLLNHTVTITNELFEDRSESEMLVDIEHFIHAYNGEDLSNPTLNTISFLYQIMINAYILIIKNGWKSVFFEGYDRVINANIAKEIGPNTKRNSFQLDLVKPEGWVAPDHSDLV